MKTQLAAVERARDALGSTGKAAEEPNTPAARLQAQGHRREVASLLWPELLFRSFGNRRQLAGDGGSAPGPGRAAASNGINAPEVGQPPPAQDHDRAGLVLAASPAGIRR